MAKEPTAPPKADKLAAWMEPFIGFFTAPTWQHVLVLVCGTILSPGRRTVAAALRTLGLDQTPHFTNYHRVLNRNQWNSHQISRRLLHLLVATFNPTGPVVIGIDDTIEAGGARRSRHVASTATRSAPPTATW